MPRLTETEIWVPVAGFEGLYEVSNIGRVRAPSKVINGPRGRATRKAKMLKPYRKSNGYLNIVTVNNNIKVYNWVHRLVAQAFIPNPENKKEVNHKDFDKTNNRVSNLEWCSRKENSDHARATKDFYPKSISYPVLDTYTGVVYRSIHYLCKQQGLERNVTSKQLHSSTSVRYKIIKAA